VLFARHLGARDKEADLAGDGGPKVDPAEHPPWDWIVGYITTPAIGSYQSQTLGTLFNAEVSFQGVVRNRGTQAISLSTQVKLDPQQGAGPQVIPLQPVQIPAGGAVTITQTVPFKVSPNIMGGIYILTWQARVQGPTGPTVDDIESTWFYT